MSPSIRSIYRAGGMACIAISLIVIAGCNKGDGKQPDAAMTPLALSDEDVLVLRNSALTSGPSITGSAEPERRADLRGQSATPALMLRSSSARSCSC